MRLVSSRRVVIFTDEQRVPAPVSLGEGGRRTEFQPAPEQIPSH